GNVFTGQRPLRTEQRGGIQPAIYFGHVDCHYPGDGRTKFSSASACRKLFAFHQWNFSRKREESQPAGRARSRFLRENRPDEFSARGRTLDGAALRTKRCLRGAGGSLSRGAAGAESSLR